MRQKLFIISVVIMISLTLVSFASAEDPIKIGAPLALSGKAAFAGIAEKNTLIMCAEEFNKAGGLDGRPIEFIFYDTEMNPDTAVNMVKRLIKKDQVVAIVGITSSWEGMAVLPILEKEEMPSILLASSSGLVTPVRKWIFKIPSGDNIVVSKIMEHMKANGINKIALISSSDGYGEGGRDSILTQAPGNGIEIIFDERFAGDETDLTPLINKIKNTNAQAVVSWSSKRTPSVVALNYHQLSMQLPLYLGHAALAPAFIKAVGNVANGYMTASMKFDGASALPDSDPQKKVCLDYQAAYQSKFGEAANQFGATGYDAFYILVAALKKGGTEKAKLRDAIEQISNFVGTQGIFNYSPDDHAGLEADSILLYKVFDGDWKPMF
ncbi:MAG: ABC transporter substrate-binding protein [Proteobacteria bacterium]|nr:ABC transporter substrate-binding protein [Pseudomonadota bacterium]